jgi:hypothetical protein
MRSNQIVRTLEKFSLLVNFSNPNSPSSDTP